MLRIDTIKGFYRDKTLDTFKEYHYSSKSSSLKGSKIEPYILSLLSLKYYFFNKTSLLIFIYLLSIVEIK